MEICYNDLHGTQIYNGFQVVESWVILWLVRSLWVCFSLSFTFLTFLCGKAPQLEGSSQVSYIHNNKLHAQNVISQFSFQFLVTHVEPVNIPKVTKALQDIQTPTTTKGLQIVPHPYGYTYVLQTSQHKKSLSATFYQNTNKFLSPPWFSWYCCKICYLRSSLGQVTRLTVFLCSTQLAFELP